MQGRNAMRVLIFHGYLLSGTGSNIYTANLARALVLLGHDVHLVCQDSAAEENNFVNTVGEMTEQGIELRQIRASSTEGNCTVYRPDIGGLLPVYVADSYQGFEAKTFDELTETELEIYLKANVESVRAIAEEVKPDAALANHLVMGPVILSRALDGRTPYAVKIHGSALEYTVGANPRFLPEASEGLEGARTVLVGSHHIENRLVAVMNDRGLRDRVRIGPPGVDTKLFRPAGEGDAQAAFNELMQSLSMHDVEPERDRLVVFVGKLIVSKGVDLLLAAWPYVIARHPGAKLLIVGFGRYRDALERMLSALTEGDRGELEQIAARGRELEGGPAGRLTYLSEFLIGLSGDEGQNYFKLASQTGVRNVKFLGKFDHEQLSVLLPACEVMAVPSTFPEAFGMVAAEAAACGVWPIAANHSGLAEVSTSLASVVPAEHRELLSFDLGKSSVLELAARINDWMDLHVEERDEMQEPICGEAKRLWSWEGVARGVLDAALGKL